MLQTKVLFNLRYSSKVAYLFKTGWNVALTFQTESSKQTIRTMVGRFQAWIAAFICNNYIYIYIYIHIYIYILMLIYAAAVTVSYGSEYPPPPPNSCPLKNKECMTPLTWSLDFPGIYGVKWCDCKSLLLFILRCDFRFKALIQIVINNWLLFYYSARLPWHALAHTMK